MKDVAEKDIKTFLYTQYIQGFKGKQTGEIKGIKRSVILI